MTPERIKKIRNSLGLSQSGLAEALRMSGNGGRTIRAWESGEREITGPASIAIELLYEKHLSETVL